MKDHKYSLIENCFASSLKKPNCPCRELMSVTLIPVWVIMLMHGDTEFLRGFVHPLQDVALHIYTPRSSTRCLSHPLRSLCLLICRPVLFCFLSMLPICVSSLTICCLLSCPFPRFEGQVHILNKKNGHFLCYFPHVFAWRTIDSKLASPKNATPKKFHKVEKAPDILRVKTFLTYSESRRS